MSIAGIRDPIMIAGIDEVISGVRERVKDNFSSLKMDYFLDFKVYGRNGVMGALEPWTDIQSHELGIIIEAVARDQATANTICSFARSTMLHYGYKGRVATAGNLAFPYSPSDLEAGEVYTFSVYHIIEADDPAELFPIEIITVGGVMILKIRLIDTAEVIRSKNSGPYELTFDIIFKDWDTLNYFIKT